jgi:hypothetical protein
MKKLGIAEGFKVGIGYFLAQVAITTVFVSILLVIALIFG